MQAGRMVTGNTHFAVELFKELVRQQGGGNVLASPWSVASALALAYNGAEGATAAAMARALGWEGLPPAEVNRAYAAVQASLAQAGAAVQLAVANALWAAAGAGLISTFVDAARSAYGAEVREADLGDPATVGEINDWVRGHTAGKIERILDSLDPAALLVLVNAVYFKGRWSRPFDRAATRVLAFRMAGGRKKRQPMMGASGRYRYLRGPDFQAVRLPYGQGRLAMYVLLPDEPVALPAFVASLSAERWQEWLAGLRERDGRVVLPRFRVEYGADLRRALSALGMERAFEMGRAEFGGLARAQVAIDQVRHQAVVEVNEEGTEAAAATAVSVTRVALVVPSSFRMVVDRPFVCAIQDDETGVILFLGAVQEPA